MTGAAELWLIRSALEQKLILWSESKQDWLIDDENIGVGPSTYALCKTKLTQFHRAEILINQKYANDDEAEKKFQTKISSNLWTSNTLVGRDRTHVMSAI